MRSLRPTSLNKIIKIIATLNSLGGAAGLADISNALGTSVKHVKELARLLEGLGLAAFDGKTVTLTPEGGRFLASYASRSTRHIDEVLSRVDQYRRARRCFEGGATKPSDVARCAGLNIVAADIALRLIKEVRSLEGSSDPPGLNPPVDIDSFELALYEAYRSLATERRNKYVLIHDLMSHLAKKLRLNPRAFVNLLAKLAEERRGLVILVPSPSLVDRPSVEIGGRRYTYLAFLEGIRDER